MNHNFNNSVQSSAFPTAIKCANVKPVFQKEDRTDKENYRLINISPYFPLNNCRGKRKGMSNKSAVYGIFS